MSAVGGNAPPKAKFGLFDQTQSSFWGGPSYDQWMLIVATIFGGALGLDHLLLRSPTTAFAKVVLNILSLGLWYFYDVLQVLGEKENVMKQGLSAPIVGPLGIGAGMFVDNQPEAKRSKSPWRQILFTFLLWVPFGFDFFAAGDMNGALVKLLCTLVFFLWPIAIIASIYNWGQATFTPKALFTKGTSRMFPFSFFMDPFGPSKLGPIDLPVPKTKEEMMCEPGGSKGIGRTIVDGVVEGLSLPLTVALKTGTEALEETAPLIAPAVQAGLSTAFPGIVPAVESAALAVKTSASAATLAAEGAKNVITAATTGAVPAAKMGHNLAETGLEAIDAVPQIASAVSGKLNQFTDPKKLAAAAVAAKALSGGAVGGGAISDAFDVSESALLFLFVLVIGGGSLLAFFRMKESPWFGRTPKNDARDDAPPQPRDV